MSSTFKRKVWHPVRKEDKDHRRAWHNKYRAVVRKFLRIGRFDDIPPPRKTEGWDTD